MIILKTTIENKLKEIEEKENVKIIMAVESGSRKIITKKYILY